MTFKEKLIKFQNDAEKDFLKEKSIKSITKYLMALAVFFSSTIVAGFSFPFRFIINKFNSRKYEIVDVTTENIENILDSNNLIILNFTAQWCGPCMLMKEILEKFAQSQSQVAIGKINIDTNGKLSERYGVRGIPQFLLLEKGKEIKRHVGPMTLKQLQEFHQ